MVEWLTVIVGAVGIAVIAASAAVLLAVAVYGLVHMVRDIHNAPRF